MTKTWIAVRINYRVKKYRIDVSLILVIVVEKLSLWNNVYISHGKKRALLKKKKKSYSFELLVEYFSLMQQICQFETIRNINWSECYISLISSRNCAVTKLLPWSIVVSSERTLITRLDHFHEIPYTVYTKFNFKIRSREIENIP